MTKVVKHRNGLQKCFPNGRAIYILTNFRGIRKEKNPQATEISIITPKT